MALVGRHVSIAGGLDLAYDRSVALDATAMQIFVTNPRGWAMSALSDEAVEAFRRKGRQTRIAAIAHMPYLPNIASSNSESFKKSVASLIENMERCRRLGIGHLVTHMGSHMDQGKEKGLANVARAVREALDSVEVVSILLENEAGHKNSVGDRIEDLAAVADEVDGKRLGFCLDTCHLFASGYDIGRHEVLDEMFSKLDIKKVKAIHLNDAMKDLGSNLDRHANIGYGYIGNDRFRSFLKYGEISSKIVVLETPLSPEISEEDELTLAKSLFPK